MWAAVFLLLSIYAALRASTIVDANLGANGKNNNSTNLIYLLSVLCCNGKRLFRRLANASGPHQTTSSWRKAALSVDAIYSGDASQNPSLDRELSITARIRTLAPPLSVPIVDALRLCLVAQFFQYQSIAKPEYFQSQAKEYFISIRHGGSRWCHHHWRGGQKTINYIENITCVGFSITFPSSFWTIFD
jgi:hypothetical protein